MRIAQASKVMQHEEFRKDVAQALSAGEEIHVESPAALIAANPFSQSPLLISQIALGASLLSGIQVTDANREFLQRALLGTGPVPTAPITTDKRKLFNFTATGALSGTIIGAAVGVLLEQVRAVHPTSAVAFDATLAVLGCTVGATMGAGATQGSPSVSITPAFSHTGEVSCKIAVEYKPA
ncbi:hypothetical protein [Granulicella tundricola]|uniref:Uncharacterized protein n=1 Tax=Granulicella tundricola (strain ATCC BAA-1859 / DSM 23138 / MP5ACTX9) TaxID=1198114 RepID=E8WYU8_GRATM|nr:hypothetical protein [Granulicella tundricola]ADW68784.1 hypothetical protein AciX9_1736 [Granulicella tundricola MP5ACTX9]